MTRHMYERSFNKGCAGVWQGWSSKAPGQKRALTELLQHADTDFGGFKARNMTKSMAQTSIHMTVHLVCPLRADLMSWSRIQLWCGVL